MKPKKKKIALPYAIPRHVGFTTLALYIALRDIPRENRAKIYFDDLFEVIGCPMGRNNMHRVRLALKNLVNAGWIEYTENKKERYITVKLQRRFEK